MVELEDVCTAPAPMVSVVVPVYRNRATVVELWSRIGAVLLARGMSFEGIFVIDGCPEDSGIVLEAIAEQDSRLRVVHHPARLGQRAAWWTGVQLAGGDWTIVMDADLQDPPEAIAELLDAGGPGIGAVYGGRRGAYESPSRLLTGRCFRGLITRLAGIPRDAGGFLMLSKTCKEAILGQPFQRPYLPAMPGFTTFQTRSVPVVRTIRHHGSSTQGSARRIYLGVSALCQVVALRLGLCQIRPSRKVPS